MFDSDGRAVRPHVGGGSTRASDRVPNADPTAFEPTGEWHDYLERMFASAHARGADPQKRRLVVFIHGGLNTARGTLECGLARLRDGAPEPCCEDGDAERELESASARHDPVDAKRDAGAKQRRCHHRPRHRHAGRDDPTRTELARQHQLRDVDFVCLGVEFDSAAAIDLTSRTRGRCDAAGVSRFSGRS